MTATCTPRTFADRARAARNAIDLNPGNAPPDFDISVLDGPSGPGDRLALDVARRWPETGVRLTVRFLDTHDAALKNRILSHLNAWSERANVRFVLSDVDPVVRIARVREAEQPGQGGFWSYVGTDIHLIPPSEPTMNLEGFTMSTPASEYRRVVRHEAGHTLGFPHEHMRHELVQRLDRARVIADYMASQGWTEQEVIDQVLTPLEESSLMGTSTADPTSIMCYQIDGSLTVDGQPIVGGLDINEADHRFAAQVYPKPALAGPGA